MTGTGKRNALVLGLLLAVVLLLSPPSARAEDQNARAQDLLISTHVRLSFEKEVQRVAVADPEILDSETLSDREVLLLGRKAGRTTLMVWFTDGSTESYLFHVRRDLSLLEEALREIHPSITVQAAPDRDAVVLRGLVPDISYVNAAEDAAQRYLEARRRPRGAAPVVQAPAPEGAPAAGPARRLEGVQEVVSTAAVINLIRVENLPGRLEERMAEAIRGIGANDVTVRRLARGRLPDDEEDIFVLEGEVDTQVTLVRVLSLAQSMLGVSGEADLKVRADESGALTTAGAGQGAGQFGQGSRALSQLLGGTAGGNRLDNLIEANLGRAKVIEASQGRILSFIEVRDVPQVRVDIRLYEVNTSKLRDFGSNLAILGSNFRQPSLNSARVASAVQGRTAARVGAQGEDPDVQDVLGFLAGTLSNQFQLAGDNVAVDWTLSLLESRGWARSLSRPSITVLSGERAFFQVGGEVPVPESFATTTTAVTDGVFNSVTFRPFGVQLAVRPLVGEGGTVTLDVVPEISLPDPELTDALRETTGTAQTTTAFRTRYLQTTARLEDGEALLIGGLLSRNMSVRDESTPGLSDLPLLGGMFSSEAREGDEIQLVIVVHPVLDRKPTNRALMWAFPGLPELMTGVRAPPCPPPVRRMCR